MEKIRLPEAPSIEIAEEKGDQRKFAVLPIGAIWDKSINPFTFRVLAAIASYANRAGVCYVSAGKLATLLQTTRPRVSAATSKLKKAGWIKQLGFAVPGVRGATLQVMFEPDMDITDAVAIASKGTEYDLRPPDQREQELAEMIADNEREWTEQELKKNKERLAKMLVEAFSTMSDKPKMYNPVDGDTLAVKKIKQEIRSRMRQLRGEQLSKEGQQVVSEKVHKHNNICLGIELDTSDVSEKVLSVSKQVPKQERRLSYEDIVFFFENNLFNGVKSEHDLHMCSLLADRGVDRDLLERYSIAHSGQTVTHIGKLILGT
jgi:hypothetical protein